MGSLRRVKKIALTLQKIRMTLPIGRARKLS
jgi:hypothetical protein